MSERRPCESRRDVQTQHVVHTSEQQHSLSKACTFGYPQRNGRPFQVAIFFYIRLNWRSTAVQSFVQLCKPASHQRVRRAYKCKLITAFIRTTVFVSARKCITMVCTTKLRLITRKRRHIQERIITRNKQTNNVNCRHHGYYYRCYCYYLHGDHVRRGEGRQAARELCEARDGRQFTVGHCSS